MFEYNYLENLTLEELNVLGQEGWEITGILVNTTDSFNAFFHKGFQEKILMTSTESGAEFWVDKTFSYGESIVVIFLTIFLFAMIGKSIYNFLFKKNA